jgi:hypothetical protein
MIEQAGDIPYISAYEWVAVVSGIRFGSVTVGKKTIAGRAIKAVAFRLAWYADGENGTRVFPGPARLAVVCELDYNTVKRAYSVLRDMRLLTQVGYARGPRGDRQTPADEYRLTIPPDLLDHVHVLDPLQMDNEIERVKKANWGTRDRTVAGA